MRKLSLEDYTISLPDNRGLMRLVPYNLRGKLIDFLMHPSLGLNADALLEANEVAEKIREYIVLDDNNGVPEIMLTEKEYQLIVGVIKKLKGFCRYDVELIKRIYNCPEVAEEMKIVGTEKKKE